MKMSHFRKLFPSVLLLLSSCHLLPVTSDCFGQDASIGEQHEKIHSDFQQVLYDRQLEFSLNLFHKLYKKNDKSNLFFSPTSIHRALMLSLFGSSGDTETQLRQALQLDPNIPKTELIRQYKMEKYYMEARSLNTTQFDLKILNRIFVSSEEPLRECVSEILDSEIERLNFVNESEGSRETINNWVSRGTNGKISELIPQGLITPQTRIALANSAYFKGNWEQQFKKSNTKASLFYVSSREVSRVHLMSQRGSFRHGASESLRSYIIELPYEGGALSMYILLPPFGPDALQETVTRLNASSLREALDADSLFLEKIDVGLPRFKIQQTIQLNKALEAIGIVDLFDPTKADLSEFSTKGGLGVGTAQHKAFLEVNEEGSEAAAATVLIDTRSGRPLDQTNFICNHPFIFFIYDNAANSILFMGAFKNPKE